MNQELIISSPITTKYSLSKESLDDSTFLLERNRLQIGAYRFIFGLGIFLLPTLLVNAIYASVLELKGQELLIATGITALILLNLAIYLNNRVTKDNQTLIVGHNNIKILKNSNVLHNIPFEQIKITVLNWGMDENTTQPAIRLQAKNFPCMTIGSRASTPTKAKSQQTVDCTTFLISDNQQWNSFIKTLENHIEK